MGRDMVRAAVNPLDELGIHAGMPDDLRCGIRQAPPTPTACCGLAHAGHCRLGAAPVHPDAEASQRGI